MDTPFIETDCNITHEGKTFEAGGAVITPEHAIVYLASDPIPTPDRMRSGRQFFPSRPRPAACGTPWHGTLTDWHGNKVGTYAPQSTFFQRGARMYAISARINGQDYYGRTQGEGMYVRLTAYKGQ
jgi:hypothetical protein